MADATILVVDDEPQNRRVLQATLSSRLIAADGTEWDRKELKIANAFRYDEEQGRYTLISDITLHGWCEPKCAETPSTHCDNPK
jgi:CheY-like chemotaxis protein